MAETTIETIVSALGGQRKSGGGWLCHCPAHDDRRPSLSIDLGANGTPVLKCFSGCSQVAVITALRNRGLWQDHEEADRPVTSWKERMLLLQAEKRKEDDLRRQAKAAATAANVWKAAAPAKPDHPYLLKKQVKPTSTLREIDFSALKNLIGYAPQANGEPLAQGRILVVPLKYVGKLSTVEMIDQESRKTALAGGKKGGAFWATNKLPSGDGAGLRLLIGEGVATVLTARLATGYPAVAALACGNLPSIAEQMRNRYPKAEIIVLTELQKQSGEPDSHALEAANAIDGKLAVPDFGPDRPEGMTDFNDLQVLKGIDEVRRQIVAVSVATVATVAVAEWSEPFSLITNQKSAKYPLDDLPGIIGDAVREVTNFVQCPVSLAAFSALSAVSTVVQGLTDIRRAEKLEGPTSLYCLAIADSGERKSTVDEFFSKPIRQWEAQKAEEIKADLKRYTADQQAWEAKKAGIITAIKEAAKKGRDTDTLETKLSGLEANGPEQPKVPRILFGDATPEALAYRLAIGWPVGGVLSSEAGIVFGGYGMGRDSAMRNMALLNSLWGAERVVIDRKASPSFAVQNARLTMGLAVQSDTIKAFLESSNGLARGIGWLARFLIAWPESTQGTRMFHDPPKDWPKLGKFHRRLESLLDHPLSFDEAGNLSPTMIELSPEAKKIWISFHDEVEEELRPGRDMAETRDIASKGADNAARLAGLFHVFENGPGGQVGADNMERAARIITWHLYEARSFIGEIAMSVSMTNAMKLDDWLIKYCRENRAPGVSTRNIQQWGPGCTRDRKILLSTLAELVDAVRVRLVKDGRRQVVEVNPALLEN